MMTAAATRSIRDAVQSFAPESSGEEVSAAVQYLLEIYMNMRSLDFVRQIMGMSRRSLAQGTRPTLGVMSGIGGSGAGKSAATTNGTCCFFCTDNGHTDTNCRLIDAAPKAGEATTKQVVVSTKRQNKTIIWHYCTGCQGWRHHSTAEHDESIEEIAEKINGINALAKTMSDSDERRLLER